MQQKHIETILSFLNIPLDCGDEIFERFSELPGAISGKGNMPLERYVYIPGTRKDRVVLTAHIDTVWDKSYNKCFSGERSIEFKDGIFLSTNPDCGIGADDRAGCAMLWELLNSGHSILITDGEEKGKHGAKHLKNSSKKLYRELNRHCFMMALDWRGTNGCLYNQVDNTKRFKRYIESQLGFTDDKAKGGCDLQILCRYVCGVNIGVGYHKYHTSSERLVLSEWENTLAKLEEFLAKPQVRFRSKFFPPYIRVIRPIGGKVLRFLKLKK